jgi:uncharacterized protein (DUF58 family)
MRAFAGALERGWKNAFERFFGLGRDEEITIVLVQRRIYIVPSGAGLLFALVLALMLVGAINYELGLGHALVFLLASIGLVTMLHTFRNLVSLSITPGRSAAVFAGESARFVVQVDNRQARARRALEFSFAGTQPVLLDLAAGGNAGIAVALAAPQRGRLRPGRLTIATRYPLGLFRAWSYLYPGWSTIVYPAPLASPLPPPTSATAIGGEVSDATAGDDDFAGLRQRQPADSPRHVAWKQAARDGGERPLLVKQFAGAAAGERWLDWRMTSTDADVETRLSLLAGWVLAADAERAPYGLRLPGRQIAPASGETHRAACLEALALHGES